MWQRHNIPMDDFLDWPYHKKIAHIASEIQEAENPVRAYPVYFLGKGGG